MQIDQRLTELEIKASFTEDLVEHLNQIVIRQQQDLDALARQIGQLRAQLPRGEGAPVAAEAAPAPREPAGTLGWVLAAIVLIVSAYLMLRR